MTKFKIGDKVRYGSVPDEWTVRGITKDHTGVTTLQISDEDNFHIWTTSDRLEIVARPSQRDVKHSDRANKTRWRQNADDIQTLFSMVRQQAKELSVLGRAVNDVRSNVRLACDNTAKARTDARVLTRGLVERELHGSESPYVKRRELHNASSNLRSEVKEALLEHQADILHLKDAVFEGAKPSRLRRAMPYIVSLAPWAGVAVALCL